MTGTHAVKAWLGVCLVSLLTACSQGSGFSDLDQLMAETRAKPRGDVEPLPEFMAYEAVSDSEAGRGEGGERTIEDKKTMVSEKAGRGVETDTARAATTPYNYDPVTKEREGTAAG